MPVSLPVGDVLRAIFKGGWFGALLRAVKGFVIRIPGGTEILLDRDHGPSVGPGGKPHEPGPPLVRR